MAHERQDILNHVINDEWIEENRREEHIKSSRERFNFAVTEIPGDIRVLTRCPDKLSSQKLNITILYNMGLSRAYLRPDPSPTPAPSPTSAPSPTPTPPANPPAEVDISLVVISSSSSSCLCLILIIMMVVTAMKK